MKKSLMTFCILIFISTPSFASFTFCTGVLNKRLSMPISIYDHDKDLEKIELLLGPDRAGIHLKITDNSRKELSNQSQCFLQMDNRRTSRANNYNSTFIYTSDSCFKVSDYISLFVNERKVGQLSYSSTRGGYINYIFDLKCN